jgi:hypothetical protein
LAENGDCGSSRTNCLLHTSKLIEASHTKEWNGQQFVGKSESKRVTSEQAAKSNGGQSRWFLLLETQFKSIERKTG